MQKINDNVEFNNAVTAVVDLIISPSNEEKLEIYGLYKQATLGDVNIPQPSFFDFAGNAKWKSWQKMKGKSIEIAQNEYVELVEILVAKYGQKNTIMDV